MATTGFWPVRGKLKKVLDYADNPDKTTERKYLDEDLYQALRYTEQDEKTDEKKYVSGVNCSAAFAYREMVAVKQRFGTGARSLPTMAINPSRPGRSRRRRPTRSALRPHDACGARTSRSWSPRT